MRWEGSQLAAQPGSRSSVSGSYSFSDPAWCVLADPVLAYTHCFLWAHQVAPANEQVKKQLPHTPDHACQHLMDISLLFEG